MNQKELLDDLDKFKAYAEANGVRVIAHVLMVEFSGKDTFTLGYGQTEQVQEMFLSLLTDRAGFMLVHKP